MTTVLVVAGVLIALPGLAAAAHLGLLALASLLYRDPATRGEASSLRFLVLVPAHDEELVIGDTLRALNADLRERDQVLVVADRCTDATAEIARGLGALVLERGSEDEPGRAAARQAGLRRAQQLDWDGVLMIDADSIVEPGFMDACERALACGFDAVQARSESSRARTLAMEASLAAFTLQGITIPRGRDRLGISVRLRGTGMALRRGLVYEHRMHAPASEDLFLTLDLMLTGVRCRHVEGARMRSDGAASWGSFGGQKVRYEAGRMSAARAYVPKLLRRGLRERDVSCLEAAWFLASPPFAVAVLSLVLGTALAALSGVWIAAAVVGAGLLTLVAVIVTGLIQGRVGARTWLALLAAPWYVAWKAVIQVRALVSVLRRDDCYGPTART